MTNWVDTLHARVEITLDANDPPRFVAFPAAPAALNPSTFLADCMLTLPAGFTVADPSKLVILYDHREDKDGYMNDVLAEASRRARAAVERLYGKPATNAYLINRNDTYSMVKITLETAIPTEVDFKFTAFPRKQEMTPNVIAPNTFLENCLKRPAAGFFVADPKNLVILYDQTEGDEANLADAAERARLAIENICMDISTCYRVEEHTRFIVSR